jgi:hypothetical protein
MLASGQRAGKYHFEELQVHLAGTRNRGKSDFRLGPGAYEVVAWPHALLRRLAVVVNY